MYLLAQRVRAINLARYGQHLSDGILDIVRPLAGDLPPLPPKNEMRPRVVYGRDVEDDSPYSESPYRASA
ncbi:MAG: hypothetical protein U0164_23195 [Gemmatimonadaceae bacterium]